MKRDADVIGKLRSLVYESVDDRLDLFAADVSKEEIEFLDDKGTSAFNIEEEDDDLA